MKTGLVIFILFVSYVNTLRAQFMHFEVDIEPNTTVHLVEELKVFALKADGSTNFITLQSKNKGILEVKGYAHQMVGVSYEQAVVLKNQSFEENDTLLFEAEAAYNNSDVPAISESTRFNSQTFFKIYDDPNGYQSDQFWRSAYIYIFGKIKTKDTKPGFYRGELTVNISYY